LHDLANTFIREQNPSRVKNQHPQDLKEMQIFLMVLKYLIDKMFLTCKIFIRTTSSLPLSVPTNLACVTASAKLSTTMAADSWPGSKRGH
jgi:hypothetical protein